MNRQEIFGTIFGGFLGFSTSYLNGPDENKVRQYLGHGIGIGLGALNWRWMPYVAFAMYPSQKLLRQQERNSRY